MALIHLIRHARPALTGVMLGQRDPPLAGDPAEPPPLAATVFSSPLLRCRQTARLLFPDHEIRILPDLAEIGMGEWEGKSWREIELAWPELAAAKLRDWTSMAAPAGESWDAFEKRVSAAWRVIQTAAPPVAVVAHSGVNAVLRQLVTGLDPTGFAQGYNEVISLEY